MTKKNKFSIVCAIFNTEKKYFERLLLSLSKQNYDNYEFILINNGSTNNIDYLFLTKQHIKTQIKYKLINKNVGFGEGRNIGVSISSGDYLLFVDSDDELKESSLLELNNICNKNYDCDVFLFGFNLIKTNNNEKIEMNIYENKKLKKDININTNNKKQIKFFNKINLYSAGWSKLIKLDFIKKNKIKYVFDKENKIEDLYYHLNILLLSNNICIINDFKYYIYYLSEFSTLNKMLERNSFWFDYLDNILLSIDFCKKNKELNFDLIKEILKKMNKIFFNIHCYKKINLSAFILLAQKYKCVINSIYKKNNFFIFFIFVIKILFYFICSTVKNFPYKFSQYIKKK